MVLDSRVLVARAIGHLCEFFWRVPSSKYHDNQSFGEQFSAQDRTTAMAQSRLVSAFETGAIRFNVAESDFIVLKKARLV